MRKFAIALAAVAAAAAVPAQAGEGRVEIRSGIIWAAGEEEAVLGGAAGYDFGQDDGVFVGVEGSMDKALVGGARVVFGATGRVGTHVGTKGKVFAAGGYSFNDGDAWHLGGGYEHTVAENVYVKAEYRHFFADIVDVNSAVVGVGVRF